MATTNNAYGYSNYQVYEPSTSTPQAVLMRYLKHWRWFLLSLIVGLIGAYFYVKTQTPIYKIQASLLIKDSKKGLEDESFFKDLAAFNSKKMVENEIEILKSFTLMEKAVSGLGLDVQYFQPTTWGKREVYDKAPIRLLVEQADPLIYEKPLTLTFPDAKTVQINEQNYPVNQSIKTPYGRLRVFARQPLSAATPPVTVRVATQAQVAEDYQQRLKIEPTTKASTVLVLSLEDAVPAKGEAVLNQLLKTYNDASIVDKNRVSAATHEFIEKRLRLISQELMAVERNVESYKSAQGITDLGTQAQTFLQTVQQNDAQLNQLDIQLGSLNDLEKYVNSKSGTRGITPATLGLNDPTLLGLINKVTELELQRDELARTVNDRNPNLQALDAQIKATKTNILENVQTLKQMLTTSQTKMVATNQRMEGQIRSIPIKERALLDITRQQAIKNNLYTYLLEKREANAIAFASAVSDSRVVDPARSGAFPVKPVGRMYYLLFGLVSLLIPLGVIAGRDVMNDRVSRRSDVEDVTHIPIIGEVMQHKQKEPLVIKSHVHSAIAEQIRALRTNVQHLSNASKDSQVVLFTSSISGEGKSFLSMNLGASLALLKQPTVILEMDLRNPKLHKALSVENTVGISDYLVGEAELDDILKPVPGYPNYRIITSGTRPHNPTELLASGNLADLFQVLRQQFAFILVDTPPIGLMTDAQLIAPYADTTLYVIRHELTPKAHLRMIEFLYREHKFNRLSLVLNAVNSGQSYLYNYQNDYFHKTDSRISLRRLGRGRRS